MGKQIKKVCKHEPGEVWKDGCCSPQPPHEQVIESVAEQSTTAQTEALKHCLDATAL
ncbi:MAG: hypothetical protein KME40_00270 [Komarekiella atlantica HA4396-MV6]|jgi:hypothetical protein|nr:hypothetical protein [Komarekiella atlantica HA4396-MV6]